jgi:hypothetical protein
MLIKKNYYPECEGDPNKIPGAVRLKMAYNHYLDQNKKKLIRQAHYYSYIAGPFPA